MGNAPASQAQQPSTFAVCQYCSCDIDLKTRPRQCPRCHGHIASRVTNNNHYQQNDHAKQRRGSKPRSLLDRLRSVSSVSSTSTSSTASSTIATPAPPPPTKSGNVANSNQNSPLNNNGTNSGNGRKSQIFLEHVHIAPFGSTLSDSEEKEMNDELLINSFLKPYFSSRIGQRERLKAGNRFMINKVEFKVYCCYPPEGMNV